MNSVSLTLTKPNPQFANTAKRNSEQEISRLITAAVVNKNFCNLLLSNPEEALARGYNGEDFLLARDEQELIYSIHAVSLADFALQLAKHQTTKKVTTNAHWGNRQFHKRV